MIPSIRDQVCAADKWLKVMGITDGDYFVDWALVNKS